MQTTELPEEVRPVSRPRLRRSVRGRGLSKIVALSLTASLGCGISAAIAQQAVGNAPTDMPASGPSAEADREEVRYAALQAQADAHAWLDSLSSPLARRADLYLEPIGESDRLQQLSYSIDGAVARVITFDGDGAVPAPQYGELWRFERINLADGPHELHIELNYASAAHEDQPAVQLALDRHLDKTPGPIDIEIGVQKERVFSQSKIRVAVLHAQENGRNWISKELDSLVKKSPDDASYGIGGENDPSTRHARYLSRNASPDAGVIELLESGRGIPVLPDEYWLQVAATLRDAGLLDRAESVVDRLISKPGNKQEIATQRLYLAEARYEQGQSERARALLASARRDLPEYRLQDWRFTQAQLMFAEGKSTDAIQILKQTDSEQIEAFRYMSQPITSLRSAGYQRFNLAAALIKNGDEQTGMSWMDLVGRMQTRDDVLLALRDKANLTLGWQFLKAKQGRTALGIFGRIRSEGPYSEAALLGVGWAQLVPAGKRISRSHLPDENAEHPNSLQGLPAPIKVSLSRLRVLEPELHGDGGAPLSFERDDPPADRDEGLRRAAAIWSVLGTRESDDPAVQEGMLAIAYAEDQLDHRARAKSAYARAIGLLNGEKERLAETTRFVADGRLPEAIDRADSSSALFLLLQHMGASPDSSSDALYSRMEGYRGSGRLLENLRQAERQISAAAAASSGAASSSSEEDGAAADDAMAEAGNEIAGRLRSAIAEVEIQRRNDAGSLRQFALEDLVHRSEKLERYLNAAYFSAARIEDRTYRADGPG